MSESHWCPLCGKWGDHRSGNCPTMTPTTEQFQGGDAQMAKRCVGESQLTPPGISSEPTSRATSTPEPAKWAVEAAKEIHETPYCIDSVVRGNEWEITAAIIQRHADSAMEEMRKRIADLQGQLDLDRQDRNDLREQLMATAAELAKVNEQAAIAGRQLAAAEDELERWQSTFEAWGEEPAEAHDKIIAASDERVEEIKKDAEEWEKTLDAQVEVNFKLQAECGRLMELEDNLRAQLAAAEEKVKELEKDRNYWQEQANTARIDRDAARTTKETSQ